MRLQRTITEHLLNGGQALGLAVRVQPSKARQGQRASLVRLPDLANEIQDAQSSLNSR